MDTGDSRCGENIKKINQLHKIMHLVEGNL